MKPKSILFDLDGTLTDPGLGITNSVMYALAHYGIPRPARTALYPFIGPPLADSFMAFYGFTPDKAMEAVGVYREYFAQKGLFENEVYPGIPELLAGLRARGRRLAVATSKPEEFARQILVHFDLAQYFDLIAGNTLAETRPTKDAVIAHALQTLGLSPEDAVMVGDRKHDVLGAAAHGMDCIGVLYGYGSREELEAAGATMIAPTVDDLAALLAQA